MRILICAGLCEKLTRMTVANSIVRLSSSYETPVGNTQEGSSVRIIREVNNKNKHKSKIDSLTSSF